MGVFRLNVATFEEIEHDQNATSQAAIIVAIVALLSALGAGIGASISGANFITNFIGTLVWTFIGWFLWSLVSYLVGTSLFGGKATLDEMLRVIGFAYAPQFLAIIPCIGALIGGIWSLVAGFIAIRQGLDLDDLKAFLTIVVGFIVYIIGSLVINALLGGIGLLFS
jgi:hypothetical protein